MNLKAIQTEYAAARRHLDRLGRLIRQPMPVATNTEIDRIKHAVAQRYLQGDTDLLSSRDRHMDLVAPRHIAIWLATRHTHLSQSAIARHFRRDHGTVAHAKKTVQDRIDTDPNYAAAVRSLEKDLLL